LWNDMENMEERQVELWKDLENREENCEKIWKIWKKRFFFDKTTNTACTVKPVVTIILKMNLPLYKGFTLEITNKWWPLTTLNRWLLYRIKIYSKIHKESTKVTVMSNRKWFRKFGIFLKCTKNPEALQNILLNLIN
jgi:hypothetical protein